jgi:hypothetical protein
MNGIFSTCGICHGKIGLKPCNCVLQNNKHDLGVAESIGFDKGYKAATAKTLTDEEVIRIVKRFVGTEPLVHEIEQAILKKASEK